ncbi:MAG TPA: SCO family protein [Gemmatimonadaceae bacterium]|nr:SCO family protein [Gemmatimonadaceae bacterium]
MIRSQLPCFIALAVVTVAGCREPAPFHATVIADPLLAPALRLRDSRERTFDLGAEKGRMVLVYFGYTHCPDVCPTTLADFARARRTLNARQRDAVRFVFVSVDPERDTPAVAQEYVQRFDSSFVGLAPGAAQLDSIKTAWGFTVERDSMPGMKADVYGVTHPAGVFVIDREGRVRLVFAPATKPDDIASDLKRML